MIFPAQFRHGKNQDIIIRAFAEHIRRTNDNDSKLVLPGAGDLLSEMKGLTERLGISNRVEFPGLLCKEDVRLLYLKSNILYDIIHVYEYLKDYERDFFSWNLTGKRCHRLKAYAGN